MNRILVLISVLIFILSSGCATTKKIESISTPIEKMKLEIPMPDPLKLHDVHFDIITQENFDDKLSKVNPKMFIAVDEDNYKNLSLNMEMLYNYTLQIKTILESYKSYYEETNVRPSR